MLLGFVSFVLLMIEEELIGICIPKPSFWDWGIIKTHCSDYKPYPKKSSSYDKEYSAYDTTKAPYAGRRRLFGGGGGGETECPDGKVELISLNALHQVHLLIFLAAMIHIVYSVFTVARALVVSKRFDRYERRFKIASKLHAKAAKHLENLKEAKMKMAEAMDSGNTEDKFKKLVSRSVTKKIDSLSKTELKQVRFDYEVREEEQALRERVGPVAYGILLPFLRLKVRFNKFKSDRIEKRDAEVRKYAEHHQPDFSSWGSWLYWLPYLIERQFHEPLSYFEYIATRREGLHNLMDHLNKQSCKEIKESGFDFSAFIRLSMEDTFCEVVGCGDVFWFSLIATVVLNNNENTYVFTWLPTLSLLISVIVGVKVTQGVLTVSLASNTHSNSKSTRKMSSMKEILNQDYEQDHEGLGEAKRQSRQELFWFDNPGLTMRLVQLQMYIASLTIANPLFFMWQLQHSEPHYNCARQDVFDTVYTYFRLIVAILQIYHTAIVILPGHTILLQTTRHFNSTMLECMDPREAQRYRVALLDHLEDEFEMKQEEETRGVTRSRSGKAMDAEQAKETASRSNSKRNNFKHEIQEFTRKATAYRFLTVQAEAQAEDCARRIQKRWRNKQRTRRAAMASELHGRLEPLEPGKKELRPTYSLGTGVSFMADSSV